MGPNNLSYLVPINALIYFTNISGDYVVSDEFQGFICCLNHYDNIDSNNFTVYIGGWSNIFSYIPTLYICNSNNVLLSTTNNIYFDKTYQADFKLEVNPGIYKLIVSDTKSNEGNIINYAINTPIKIIDPYAIIDHYNNGLDIYKITLGYWTQLFSGITTLEVWGSTSSDYSNSIYLLNTDRIQYKDEVLEITNKGEVIKNNLVHVTAFEYVFSSGFYWLTLINNSTNVSINIQITNPIIRYPKFNFTLDNTTHLSKKYNIILDLWSDVFTSNIPTLYLKTYLTSTFTDAPITLLKIDTSNIINNSGV